jgi:hypothetical protein
MNTVNKGAPATGIHGLRRLFLAPHLMYHARMDLSIILWVVKLAVTKRRRETTNYN